MVLIWEWFLLEIAGAAPPAVLWTTVQEPIVAWARPRIRAAQDVEWARAGHPMVIRLMDSVVERTQVNLAHNLLRVAQLSQLVQCRLIADCGSFQVNLLLDEQDAADEVSPGQSGYTASVAVPIATR